MQRLGQVFEDPFFVAEGCDVFNHFKVISTGGVGYFNQRALQAGPSVPDFWENWHLIRLLIAFLLVAASAPSAKVPVDEFRARRAALRQVLDSGVLLLKGQPEAYDQI